MSVVAPSLECVPGKYNAGLLFSQLPMDGSGDFTVTRTTTPTAGQATRVNAAGLIELVPDNIPRLDYLQPDGTIGCPALLVEPSATNSMFYSQSINSWPTKTGLTITDNNAISPDGTQNASYIQQTTGGAIVSLVSPVVTVASAQPQSVSFYAKAGQVTSVTLQLGTPALWVGSTRVRFTIDLLTGGISIISGTGTASSVAVGNGWYKYSVVTAATVASGTTSIQTVTNTVFSPNSGDGFYLWGVQWEQNTSTPTSYIPTTTAAVTRSADVISDTTASGVIGQTEGTMYAEVDLKVFPVAGSPVVGIISLNVGVANLQNCIVLGVERLISGTNRFYSLVQRANATQAGIFGPSISAGVFKVAFAYKENDFTMYVNGVQTGTPDTSGLLPIGSLSEALIGTRFTGDTQFLNDRIRAAALYPNRLTDTQLALLTSPYTSYSSMASALSYTLG